MASRASFATCYLSPLLLKKSDPVFAFFYYFGAGGVYAHRSPRHVSSYWWVRSGRFPSRVKQPDAASGSAVTPGTIGEILGLESDTEKKKKKRNKILFLSSSYRLQEETHVGKMYFRDPHNPPGDADRGVKKFKKKSERGRTHSHTH